MEIYETYIAGAKFRPVEDRAVLDAVEKGGEFDLIPEPDNKYDRHAIKVVRDGTHVGYVPAPLAAKIGKIMKAGRLMQCCRQNGNQIEIHYELEPTT